MGGGACGGAACVRDAEGAPKGGLAKGETERQRIPQQPDPKRSEGARLKKRTMNYILILQAKATWANYVFMGDFWRRCHMGWV